MPSRCLNTSWRLVITRSVRERFTTAGYDDDASWDAYQRKVGDPRPSDDVLNDPHSRAGGIVWGVLDVEDAEMGDYTSANHAIEYLSQPHDRPFFLACGLYRPHMPWQVPREYYEMFPVDSIVLPEVPSDDLDDIPMAGRRMARPEGDHANVTGSDNWPYAVQAYLASIAFADGQIGRVLDALEASEFADNTIIVFWGDHGWHLGEKEHWRKFALWEEATRTPLIIVAPGVTQPGSRCERTVDFMNIYPTLCELCDLEITDQLEGVSMHSLLVDPATAWDRPAVTTHGRGNHAVRSERFRLIHYANGSEELYDHEADPMEWTNLATDPEYADVVAELRAWLPEIEAEDAATQQELRQQ